MDINEFLNIEDNKEIVIAIINKWIDTIYDSKESDQILNSAPLYEALRMKILQAEVLTKFDLILLSLIVKYVITQLRTTITQSELSLAKLQNIYSQINIKS